MESRDVSEFKKKLGSALYTAHGLMTKLSQSRVTSSWGFYNLPEDTQLDLTRAFEFMEETNKRVEEQLEVLDKQIFNLTKRFDLLEKRIEKIKGNNLNGGKRK